MLQVVKDFDVVNVVSGVCDYLYYMGYVLFGVLWYFMVDVVSCCDNFNILEGKQKICKFYIECLLLCMQGYKVVLFFGVLNLLDISGSEFDYL